MKLHYASVLFIAILSFTFPIDSFSQTKGNIAGKIVDSKSSEELIGVAIGVKGTSIGAQTDLDGKYFLSLPEGKYDLQVVYISYKTKEFKDVEVKAGQTTMINMALEESVSELQEVVIQSEAGTRKESEAVLLLQQKNAVSMSSGISAELIRKMPDKTTADVIKRVSGASVQDGKFAIIRGLSDRYNYGLINGAPLPSTESDRKAFSLDIVPSQVVDNITISKTATPDMPGDFAGGLIQINTRDIPDENQRFVNIGLGYHALTTFKDFYRSPQASSTDWLGYDGGSRQLPSGTLSPQDFSNATTDVKVSQTNAFNNNFGARKYSAAPNISFQIGGSQRLNLFNNPLGIMAAITYNNSNKLQPFQNNTHSVGDPLTYQADPNKTANFYDYTNYDNSLNNAGLLNFNYKIGSNNKLFFKNLFTITSDDQTVFRNGRSQDPAGSVNVIKDSSVAFYYSSTRMYTSQLGGENVLMNNKLKINYVLGLTNIFKDVPDFKRNFLNADNQTGVLDSLRYGPYYLASLGALGSPDSPGRFYYKMNENSYSANLNVSYQIDALRTNVKVGGMLFRRNRDFKGRNYSFVGQQPATVDLATSLQSQNISTDLYQVDNTRAFDNYDANATLLAGFLMLETKITKDFRAIYGLRVESYNQKLNSFKDAAGSEPVKVDTTWVDPLPSVNLIYALNDKINLRASYSRTVSRPEFREFAPLAFYEFNLNSIVIGNPRLSRAVIDNFDFKFEYYFAPGQFISINPFYKYFSNPVEVTRVTAPGIRQLTYTNATGGATNYGVEIEARTTLQYFGVDFLKNITLFANLALIQSRVSLKGTGAAFESRPLQGQSPYVLNFGVSYNDFEKGWDFTISGNQVGRRIFFIANEEKFLVWENPRFVLDASITKTINKKFQIKLVGGDLLAQDLVFYHDLDNSGSYNNDKDPIVFKYRNGQTVSLSLGYNF